MKITILGDVCIDHNRVENAEYFSFGGPAMYMQMIYRTIPNAEVKIITNHSKKFIEYKNNAPLLPSKTNIEDMLEYENIVVDGERTQYAHNAHYGKINIEDNEIQKVLESTDLFIFANLIPNYKKEYIQRLLKFLPEKTLKVILPQGYFRNIQEDGLVKFREFHELDLFKDFDLVVLSDDDYPNILQLADGWSDDFDIDIVITKNYDGADHFKPGNETTHVPTEGIDDIKDSTGSGDTFTASVSYMYAKTKNMQKSLEFAHKVAGHCLKFTPDEMLGFEVGEFDEFMDYKVI